MVKPNVHYADLQDAYLFRRIAEKTDSYLASHPGARLLRMGIGDVSLPLVPAVTEALHQAVRDQENQSTFHGYMPECGAAFLREGIAAHYASRGIQLDADEVFVSSGASDELGDILHLFDPASPSLIMEPAYPAYVDANIMDGRPVRHLPASKADGFLPVPPEEEDIGLIYLCSPNNPTGAVYDRAKLAAWVAYARKIGAVILFDAAYEAFIEEEVPHSIFEIDGARECAIEICSLSKTAGFTGTRLGYTILPRELERGGMNFRSMWVRNRTTRTNGVSYILQRGGAAVFTPEGRKQVMENIAVYKRNARMLMEVFDQLGLWYCGGKNAPYLWVECPKGLGSWEFFDLLLREIQVVATPGAGFGACGEGFIRFSTFASPDATAEAASRILHLLK